MRQDSRLSRLLHVLLHMEEQEGPLTSEAIAGMLNANPALVRRTLAGLRNAGYVRSEKGHGGGWTLARPLSEISLLDVYRALGEPQVFAFGLANEAASCLVERTVNAAMERALQEARQTLLARFGEVALSDIAREFRDRYAKVRADGPDRHRP